MATYLIYHCYNGVIIVLIVGLVILVYGIKVYLDMKTTKEEQKKIYIVYVGGFVAIMCSLILAVGLNRTPINRFWENHAPEVLASNVIVKKDPDKGRPIIYDLQKNKKTIAFLKYKDYDTLELKSTNNEGESMIYLMKYLHQRHIKINMMTVNKNQVSAHTETQEFIVYTKNPKMIVQRKK